MSRLYRMRSIDCCACCVAAMLSLTAITAAQSPGGQPATSPAGRGVIGEAEVNANDVYVRSGPSMNHYTICKLAAGTRVSVLAERGVWYEIAPPPGTFSLISGQYVDTVDNKTGVINGNNVRVRAGSQINDNKYTVQTKLSKGAEVEILGENPDGFLRIKPPSNATVWISRDYVELISGHVQHAARETQAPANIADTPVPTTPQPRSETVPSADAKATAPATSEATSARSAGGSPSPVSVKEVTPESPLAELPPTTSRSELTELDEATRTEIAKPVLERQYAPLIARYQAIAANDSDGFASQYASERLRQVNDLQALQATIKRMNKLDAQAEFIRREHRADRAKMYKGMDEAPVALDAVGEVRTSATFAEGSGPERFRLVDPTVPGGRTVGYLEVPSGSTIELGDYVGRYVGIRASSKKLMTGGIDPVPVFVVTELVPMERPATKTETAANIG